MPRVEFVKSARKDYPSDGIVKGDSYYHWKFRHGGKHRSKTKPRPSQLTQSKMSGVYAAQEACEDEIVANSSADTIDEYNICVEAIADALNTAAEEIEQVGNEYNESADNMPENLQYGTQAEEMREKGDALIEWAETIREKGEEISDMTLDDIEEGDDEEQENEEADLNLDDIVSEAQEVIGECPV